MQLRSGIKLLVEIDGDGPAIEGDLYDPVSKFYRNRGDPLKIFRQFSVDTSSVVERDGTQKIEWAAAPESLGSRKL